MDRLSCLQTFVKVALAKSFTAAARSLGISKATATKHVAALERQMSAQLLVRNSQFVSMTDAGAILLESGTRLIEDFENVSEELRRATVGPAGIVRVGVPPSFGTSHLTPAIVAFTHEVPDIQVAIYIDDGNGNLVR